MKLSRRQTLQAAGGLGLYGALVALGMLPASQAAAQQFSATAFQVTGLADAMKAMGAAAPVESADVTIIAPDIAENGAVVPVGVKSAIANTQFIALLVEKNPSALAAAYDILPGAEAEASMRVKMGQSSDVYALVRADGKYYMAKKEIKVTLGGCGG